MAVDFTRTARDVAFTLEIKSPKIFENIFLNNGVLVLLGSKGRVNIQRGGNRFDERVHLGQNSNTDHRSKFAQIPTNYQDNYQTAQYGQATISGAVPVNFVEEDQNAGSLRISSVADALIEELMGTFANKVSDSLMKATSLATDPVSIKEQLPATAYGSQTTTTGGLARSSYPGTDPTSAWQTQYSNTSADLSAAAGIATVSKFLWACSPGGSALQEQPDIALTTTAVMAKMSGGADLLRRWSPNDKLISFGFDNFKINATAFIADRNAVAKSAYVLNTNYLRVQVLAGSKTKTTGSVKVIGDGAVDVPIQVRPPVEADDYLHYIIKAYLTYNLTFGGLRQHGLMDNLTEA